MSDDEKKVKYKDIVYRLRMINSSTYELENSITSMQSTMKKTLNINDSEYGLNNINAMKNNLSSVNYNINNYIVPSLNRKIYS